MISNANTAASRGLPSLSEAIPDPPRLSHCETNFELVIQNQNTGIQRALLTLLFSRLSRQSKKDTKTTVKNSAREDPKIQSYYRLTIPCSHLLSCADRRQ